MSRTLIFSICFFLGFLFSTSFSQTTLYENSTEDDFKRLCNRQTAYSTGVSDARKGLARKEDYGRICQVDRDQLNNAYNTGFNFGLTKQSGLIINEPAPAHPEIYHQLPSSQSQPYTRPVTQDGQEEQQAQQTLNPLYQRREATSGEPSYTPDYPAERNMNTGDFANPYPTQGLKALIRITPSAKPKCIMTNNGQACGYNCVNSMGNVRCASKPDQICRSDDNGNIACGYNCVVTPNVVHCAAFASDNCVSDIFGHVHCGQNCRTQGNAEPTCDIERYAP